MLCGCGSTIPDMTDTETAVVTEYATNLLVKYSTLSDRSLLNEEQLEAGIIKETEERERLLKVKKLEEMYINGTEEVADAENDAVVEDAEGNGSEPVEVAAPELSMSEFFAENNFAIDYSSYLLCQSYPEENVEDSFMVIDAANGKQLCIVRFNVSNLTSSDQTLDMYAKRGNFSLRIDNGSVVSAQSTLLIDDLSSYVGTIPAGGTEELVLVFEVSDTVSQIGSAQLIMNDQSGENTLTLQ